MFHYSVHKGQPLELIVVRLNPAHTVVISVWLIVTCSLSPRNNPRCVKKFLNIGAFFMAPIRAARLVNLVLDFITVTVFDVGYTL